MIHRPASPAAAPACPRCGYDQSGVILTWVSSCPTGGVCNECGLRFWWGEVLNPTLSTPPWSFEHTRARLARRLLNSIVRAGALWAFWRRLKMEHAIRPRRLAVMALVLAGAAHLALGAAQAWDVYLAAEDTRAWAVSRGIAVEESWRTALRALFWPYPLDSARGWVAGMVAPAAAGPEAMALVGLCAAPLAMLLLPETFQRARIRRMHIVRGAVYSLPGALAVAVAVSIVRAADATSRWSSGATWGAPLESLLVGAGFLWLSAYWYLFTRDYLRLAPAWLITLAVQAIALLTPGAVAVLVFGPRAVGFWLFRWAPGL